MSDSKINEINKMFQILKNDVPLDAKISQLDKLFDSIEDKTQIWNYTNKGHFTLLDQAFVDRSDNLTDHENPKNDDILELIMYFIEKGATSADNFTMAKVFIILTKDIPLLLRLTDFFNIDPITFLGDALTPEEKTAFESLLPPKAYVPVAVAHPRKIIPFNPKEMFEILESDLSIEEIEVKVKELYGFNHWYYMKKDDYGIDRTVLEKAIINRTIAPRRNSLEIIRIFLENGAPLDLDKVIRVVHNHSDIELLNLLTDYYPDLNKQDEEGYTCLTKLIETEEHLDMRFVEILINKGSRLDILNNEGQTVFHLRSKNVKSYSDRFSFNQKIINYFTLFRDNNIDIDAVDIHGKTALMYAVEENQDYQNCKTIINIFKNLDADFNIKDTDGNTILERAKIENNVIYAYLYDLLNPEPWIGEDMS